MSEVSALEYMLRRDRAVVIGSLLSVILLSWLYLLQGAGMDMQSMGDMVMPRSMMPWSPGYFALLVVMWAVMMTAMMLPSAMPMILLYATIAHRRRAQGNTVAGAGVFALGYVVVWAAFSLTATTLQWGLDAAALLSPAMATTSVAVAGAMQLVRGRARRPNYGATAWPVLPRLLLDADAHAVCQRCDEPVLDCGPRSLHHGGKDGVGRPMA